MSTADAYRAGDDPRHREEEQMNIVGDATARRGP